MFSSTVSPTESNVAWSPSAELLDLARQKGVGVLRELCDDFGADTSARLEALCQALTRGNLTLARNEAHAIKGSAFQMGALGLARWCRCMEQSADAGEMDATALWFEKAQLEFARVVHEMTTADWKKLTQRKRE